MDNSELLKNALELNETVLKEKIATSRSAEIYNYGDDKVLKLYFKEYSPTDVLREYANTKEAYIKGATSMEVFELVKINDRLGMIFEKIDGMTQIEYFLKHFKYLFKAGKDLANLHLNVHSKETDTLEDYKKYVISLLDKNVFNEFNEEEKNKIIENISSLPEDNKIIHLDFHNNNVMVDKNMNFTVIDWMTALKGSPLAELSMMDYLLKQAELFPGISKVEAVVFSICKKILYKRFMKAYLKNSEYTKKDFKAFRISTICYRYGTWEIESEGPKIIKELKKFTKE